MIPYDPSIESLFHPRRSETVFVAGASYTPLQLGIEGARLAYYKGEGRGTDLARLEAALRLVNYSRVQPFNGALGAQAFGAYDAARRAALVAFRGTEPTSIQDLGIDASILPVPWRGAGLVHAGFLTAFEALRGDIEQWLADAASDRQTLLVCGHSLGAAMATIAASHWRPSRLVAVASPRVGDPEFARSLAGVETHRVVNCCDLVARVPLRPVYDHVAGFVFLGHDAAILQDAPAEVVDRERHLGRGEYFRLHAFRPGNAPARDFADHSAVNYLRAFFP